MTYVTVIVGYALTIYYIDSTFAERNFGIQQDLETGEEFEVRRAENLTLKMNYEKGAGWIYNFNT